MYAPRRIDEPPGTMRTPSCDLESARRNRVLVDERQRARRELGEHAEAERRAGSLPSPTPSRSRRRPSSRIAARTRPFLQLGEEESDDLRSASTRSVMLVRSFDAALRSVSHYAGHYSRSHSSQDRPQSARDWPSVIGASGGRTVSLSRTPIILQRGLDGAGIRFDEVAGEQRQQAIVNARAAKSPRSRGPSRRISRGTSLMATETTPSAPTAISGSVQASSPLRTRKPSLRSREDRQDLLDVADASFTPMMFGISRGHAQRGRPRSCSGRCGRARCT